MKTKRKQITIDTDAASFTLALIGIVAFSVLAAFKWWTVLHMQTRLRSVTWEDYGIALFCGWIVISENKNRSARFLAGCGLVLESGWIAASLLHVSAETVRLLSLWESLTIALLLSGFAIYLIGWLWGKLQCAVAESGPEIESSAEKWN